jgi:hypothetical protein
MLPVIWQWAKMQAFAVLQLWVDFVMDHCLRMKICVPYPDANRLPVRAIMRACW